MSQQYTQVNNRSSPPVQSCSIDLTTDSLEYITYQLDRFEKLINEYGPEIFYGGYEPRIVLAS